MWLEELYKQYTVLLAKGLIHPGWVTNTKVGCEVILNLDGSVKDIIPLKPERLLPYAPIFTLRSSGIKPNFLVDNKKYLFGCGEGMPNNCLNYREAYCDYCKTILGDVLDRDDLDEVSYDVLSAFLSFLDNYQFDDLSDELQETLLSFSDSANMAFYVDERGALLDCPVLKVLWNTTTSHREDEQEKSCFRQSLITGEVCRITGKNFTDISFSAKDVGGISNSCALVSMKKDIKPYGSYGQKGLQNAPMGVEELTYASEALKYFLSVKKHRVVIGNESGALTLVCWDDNQSESALDCLNNAYAFFRGENSPSSNDVYGTFQMLASGKMVSDIQPDSRFHLLGLRGDSGRIQLVFYHKDTFADLGKHVCEYYERLNIDGNEIGTERYAMPTIYQLADVLKAKYDKSFDNQLIQYLLHVLFFGQRYPTMILLKLLNRIRMDSKLKDDDEKDKKEADTKKKQMSNTRRSCLQVAMLKAYWLTQNIDDETKEVLTVSLNNESTNVPYVLGRIFAMYEYLQKCENANIQRTMKDRFFSTMCVHPVKVFSQVERLGQKYLSKSSKKGWVEIELNKLYEKLEVTELPAQFTPAEQSAFILGYHHQMRDIYKPRKSVAGDVDTDVFEEETTEMVESEEL